MIGFPIFWSPDAKKDYIIILEYLNTNWGQREVLNFITRTENTLQLISANPSLFVSSAKKPGIHRCVLNRQISLFYRINNQNIELLRFWDNGWIRKNLCINYYVKKERQKEIT